MRELRNSLATSECSLVNRSRKRARKTKKMNIEIEIAKKIITDAARAFPTASADSINSSDVIARKSAIVLAALALENETFNENEIIAIADAILQMSAFFVAKNENQKFMQISLDFERDHQDVKLTPSRAPMNEIVRKMRATALAK